MPNAKGIIFILKNWKLIVHLLLNTKRFGVNNQWRSDFNSTALGGKRGLRYVFYHYRLAKIRAVGLGFLPPLTCYNLGWRRDWRYYKALYKKPNLIEIFLYYILHLVKYHYGCSFRCWLRRGAVAKILWGNGYEIEEVPNPLRLNAYKKEEWFLIDILPEYVGIMQFERGDKTGVASKDRMFGEETLNLIRSLGELILTPFNLLRNENGKLVEVW